MHRLGLIIKTPTLSNIWLQWHLLELLVCFQDDGEAVLLTKKSQWILCFLSFYSMVMLLADCGFNIVETLATHGEILKIQISAKEVDNSPKLSNIRIHIERVIGRICKFWFHNQLYQFSKCILSVIAALFQH